MQVTDPGGYIGKSGQLPEYEPDQQAQQQPTQKPDPKDLLLRHWPRWDWNPILFHNSLHRVERLLPRAPARQKSAHRPKSVPDPSNATAATAAHFPVPADRLK
jgi:hypothetical protein